MRKISLLVLVFTGIFTMNAQLNGSYTVNNGSVSSTNYQTLQVAVEDLIKGTRADGGTPNGSLSKNSIFSKIRLHILYLQVAYE